ncbi:protein of unknown function [Pseudomonas mediterranea]
MFLNIKQKKPDQSECPYGPKGFCKREVFARNRQLNRSVGLSLFSLTDFSYMRMLNSPTG